MPKARKLPSGHWRCRTCYTNEKGEHIRNSFTAPTKREAEHLAIVFRDDIRRQMLPENKTLRELGKSYITNRTNLLSPSTIRGYNKILRNAFLDILDVRLGNLNQEKYQEALNKYCSGRKYKTVLNAHAFYRKVLLTNGFTIADNVILPQKDKKEISIPTTEEVSVFLSNIANTRLYLYVLLAVTLGLRKSEILGLKWEDIDFDKEEIHIQRARVKDTLGIYVEKQPKTTSGNRKLKIPSILLTELKKQNTKTKYVISDKPNAIESLYKRVAPSIDFNYNFHALRHYYASVMLQEGILNKYAKERMGHATDNMLDKVYQHTFKNKQEEYDIVLDNFFNKYFSNKKEEV